MFEMMQIRKVADRSSGERLRVPVLSPVTLQDGTVVQVETGQVKLVNPDTPGDAHEPWPLLGVELIAPPHLCSVSTRLVDRAMAEGWIELVGAQAVRRPAGSAAEPASTVHSFTHADRLVFHTIDGDFIYDVVHQPDKYAAGGDDDTPVTDEAYAAGATRVDWFYGLQLAEYPDTFEPDDEVDNG